jgi:hypothetical protein
VILAKSRCRRVSTVREPVALEVQNASLPEELLELRELRIEVPLQRWNRVVKNVHSDRKLLGGSLLDFAKHKEHVGQTAATDRLLIVLRRRVLEATAALLGEGILQLSVCETSEDGS